MGRACRKWKVRVEGRAFLARWAVPSSPEASAEQGKGQSSRCRQ